MISRKVFGFIPDGATHVSIYAPSNTRAGGALHARIYFYKFEKHVLRIWVTDSDNEYGQWRLNNDRGCDTPKLN